MKLIKAIVKPHKLNDVREALTELKKDSADANKLHDLVDARMDEMRDKMHGLVDGLIEIHGTLTPEQRAELGAHGKCLRVRAAARGRAVQPERAAGLIRRQRRHAVGRERLRAITLVARGTIRVSLDRRETAMLLEAHAVADAAGGRSEAARALVNLAYTLLAWAEPEEVRAKVESICQLESYEDTPSYDQG